MIKLAVISGKGGTGKTMVTAALADLNQRSQVLADCDVDAANLQLLFQSQMISREPFHGLESAIIDASQCRACGLCQELCRFGAIHNGGVYQVDRMHCEGCGVCENQCPEGAITMAKVQNGELFVSETEKGTLVHARLFPGSGTSGLLVHKVKQKAEEMTPHPSWILVDGPPGTGCPLISTVSGMDAVLIVTEPSVSALHDLRRVVTVCRRFGPRIMVLINRYDLETDVCQQIHDYCDGQGLRVIAQLPFDPQVIEAVRKGMPITRFDSPAGKALLPIWEDINSELVANERGRGEKPLP